MDVSQFEQPAVTVRRRNDGALLLTHPEPARLEGRLIPHRFQDQATAQPDAPFLIERINGAERAMTYRAFAVDMNRVAAGLIAAGVKPRDVIVVFAENSINHALLMMAGLSIGVVIAPAAPQFLENNIDGAASYLNALSAKAIATDRPALAESLNAPLRIALGERRSGFDRLEDLADANISAVTAALAAVTPYMPAKIMLTSGSTGGPKPVLNTHGMLSAAQDIQSQLFARLQEQNAGYRLTDWLPWHHTFGGNSNFNSVIWSGGSLVIDHGKPIEGGFEATLAALKAHPPTVYVGVPASFAMLANALDEDPALSESFFGHVEGVINGGATLSPALIRRLKAQCARHRSTPLLIGGGYGMTETSAITTQVYWPDAAPDTLGLPPPGVELKLVPLEEGRYECRVRGPNVTPGYYAPDGVTTDGLFDDEGFLMTGDALCFVEEAAPEKGLVFAGRLKEEFKLSSGVWVRAGALRDRLLTVLETELIDVLIVGENRPEIGALVLPQKGVRLEVIEQKLAAFNATAGGASRRIARLAVLASPPDVAKGELTAKGSLNQIAMRRTRRDEIDALYERRPATATTPA